MSTPRPVTSAPAIQLVDVHKTYRAGPDPAPALRGVSVALGAGSITAIVGASGSGKSTLLNCAAGLDAPSSGRVVVGGQDISELSPDDLTRFRRGHIGFVFQSYNLIEHLTVSENIALPLILAGRPVDEAWRRYLVEATGLATLLDRLPSELSGGQAQRVAIARALVVRPTVVFADEPTGALDSHTGAAVLDLLASTARELGQTVVIVTHDSQVAAAADQVLVLDDGLVVDRLESASAEQVNARVLATGRRAA